MLVHGNSRHHIPLAEQPTVPFFYQSKNITFLPVIITEASRSNMSLANPQSSRSPNQINDLPQEE